jgi:iron(III) transport system substrate-binding protein
MTFRSLLALLLLVSGCSGNRKTPIVVYSPHGKEMLAAFERLYDDAHPDQEVHWLDMGSQDAYDRIRTERENPQADIWWGSPMVLFSKAEAESLLASYIPTWDSAIAPGMKSASGFWYGTFLTPEVIVYNTHALKPTDVPADWDGLIDPKWKDQIIIRSPIASGTMRIIFASILEREIERSGTPAAGFRWLLGLDANTRSYPSDPTQLYLSLAREEGLLTIWDLPDVIMTTERYGYPFGYVLPSTGTPIITEGIAIVKGCPHPVQAREFYEFVTSVESAVMQATTFARLPTRNDIPKSRLPRWMADLKLTAMDVDWTDISRHEQEWMRTWDDSIKGRGRDARTLPLP